MKSMQRTWGKIGKRSANDADVNTVMAEFKAMDDMLDRLIKDIKAWRVAWEDVLKYQYDTSEAFADLYKPLEPAGGAQPTDVELRHPAAATPARYMQKCLGLQKEYSDEKTELAHEIELISAKLVYPAEEAKQHTKLLQKTLKHRENTKLDYERYLSKAESARRKEHKSPKEEMALQTAEANLAQSQIDYQTADEQVKQTFPPVTEAVLSLLPYLLAHQVHLQTTLVGQLYTVLDSYTKTHGFPNPAPPDAEIARTWEGEFSSLRRELEEGLQIVAKGKTVHMGMKMAPDKDPSTMTGLGIRNKVINKKETKPTGMPGRPDEDGSQQPLAIMPSGDDGELAPPKPPRPGGGGSGMNSPMLSPNPAASPYRRSPSNPVSPYAPPNVNMDSKPRVSSVPSIQSSSNGTYGQVTSPPPYPTSLMPGHPHQIHTAGGVTPPSRYQTPINGTSPNSAAAVGGDYFSAARRSSQASIASSAASVAAGKKKPPPPVPAKRLPSGPLAQYVTALYDFEGQSSGDLSFREGDRIKVVKKTDSVDDWWDGELKGVVGVFPANYVKL